jgi:hypothetical protein
MTSLVFSKLWEIYLHEGLRKCRGEEGARKPGRQGASAHESVYVVTYRLLARQKTR